MTIYEVYNAIFEAALLKNPDIPVVMDGNEVDVSFYIEDEHVKMAVKRTITDNNN